MILDYLYQQRETLDQEEKLLLVGREKSFPVHRWIFNLHSSLLKRMIETEDCFGSFSGQIEVPDISDSELEDFVEFLYERKTVADLIGRQFYQIAGYLSMDNLQLQIKPFLRTIIIDNFNRGDIPEDFDDLYEEFDLKDAVIGVYAQAKLYNICSRHCLPQRFTPTMQDFIKLAGLEHWIIFNEKYRREMTSDELFIRIRLAQRKSLDTDLSRFKPYISFRKLIFNQFLADPSWTGEHDCCLFENWEGAEAYKEAQQLATQGTDTKIKVQKVPTVHYNMLYNNLSLINEPLTSKYEDGWIYFGRKN